MSPTHPSSKLSSRNLANMAKATVSTAKHDVKVDDILATSEVSRLLAEDRTPWYQKKNLRILYAFLVPSALGVEITTGTICPQCQIDHN